MTTLHRQITLAGIVAAGVVAVFAACSGFAPVGTDGQGSLAVNPRNQHINVGETVQLAAAGATGAVSWSSSDPSIATVSTGRVTGVASGTTTIHAVSGTSAASSTITVTRAATISFSSTNVSFDEIPSAPTPADSQVVDITDGGEDALTGLAISGITYAAGASDWLSATLTSTSAPAKLILRPKTSALAAGSYTATVAITSASAAAGTQIVAVRLNLLRAPVITLAANGATFSAQQAGAAPAQQSIAMTNGGDSPLTGLSTGTVTYGAGATAWLDASVSSSVAPSVLLLRPNTTTLAPGDYSATVPVISSIAGVAAVSVSVTYHVTAGPTPPTIVLSRTSVSFSATNGQATPGSTTVDVTNGGQTALTGLTSTVAYVPSTAGTWLTVSLSATTAPATVTIQPNTTGLTGGTYTATITIASAVAANQSVAINVTYTVLRPASIVLSNTAVSFSAQQSGVAPAAQPITVTNGGDAPLTGLAVGTISYGAGATAWLSASINTGTAPATLTLVPNNTALTIGDYTATVPVTSTIAGVASQTVSVTYHVTTVPPPPVIVLGQSTMSFTAVNGGAVPTQQTLSVTNGGAVALTGVTVSATYGPGATNWLTLTPSGSTAPLTVTVQPNTAALAAGTYTATVSVASAVATNSPQTMSVNYTVQRPASIVLASGTATFTGQQNGASTPAQQSIGISDGGDVPLTGLAVGTIAYSGGAANWLVASVTSTSAPSSLLLQPNTTNLAPGDYTATVPVTSNVAGVAPASVTVTYHIAAPIVVNPTSLTFAGGVNATVPAQQSVTVTSAGTAGGLTATVTYTGATTNWLTAGLVGTSTNTTLNARPTTTAIAVGTYNATIHISSTTPGVLTKDIPVTYVVNDIVLDRSTVQFTSQGITLPTGMTINVSSAVAGNSISGVTLSGITYSGRADASYHWLNPVLASSTVTSTGTTLTLNVVHSGSAPDSLGDFSAQFTVSATGFLPKTVTVNYTRKATLNDVLSVLQQTLTAPMCINCHTTGAATMGVSFANLDTAFKSLAQPRYITPGDSSEANNYLVRIIDGVAVQSGYPNMPVGCAGKIGCLSADARFRVYLWILHGAVKGP